MINSNRELPRLRRIVAVLGSALLASCSTPVPYLQPYVFPAAIEVCPGADTACRDLPTTAGAVEATRNADADVTRQLTSTTVIRRSLDVASMGLVTAFAAKSLNGGGVSHGARNLAFAAGAIYTGNNLLFPPTTEGLYMSAHYGLTCLADRGGALLARYQQASQLIGGADSRSGAKLTDDCEGSAGQHAETVRAARVARASALGAQAKARASDADFGLKLSEASGNLLQELNRQLLLNSPSPEAILNAGRSASAIASSFIASDPEGKTPAGAKAMGHCTVSDADALDLEASRSEYVAATDTLATQMNLVGDLATSCVAGNTPATTPLAASQTDLSLAKGASFNVVISGGRPPITVTWIGTTPASTDLVFEWLPASLLLRISRPAGGNQLASPAKLQVTDGSVAKARVEITVTTP